MIGVIVGAVLLLCVGCVGLVAIGSSTTDTGGSGRDATTPSTTDAAGSPTATPEEEQPVGKIGRPVRDGKFEFVVHKVKCGVPSVGGQYGGKKAQGQFCLITVTVKNISDEPQTLLDDDQRAFDSAGREYSVDSEAGWYANENTTDVWLNEINPGNQVKGVLVFDIPKSAKLTKLELHDSGFSGGVTVEL